MRPYKLYILDLDGTLYRGNQALPGAVAVVEELVKKGALVRYLTNNSSLTRESYLKKLSGMGFPVQIEEIYSSAIGTASYCADQKLNNIFVVGESGLVETLRVKNVTVINANAANVADAALGDCMADAVVAGIHKSFNYDILNSAMQHVLAGARLIATNTDATYPLEEDRLVPGAGAIVASLERCTGQEAFVIGKPNPFLIELVMREANVSATETLVVGDRYETDIESGIRAGAETHLVLTGVSKSAPAGQSWSEDLSGILVD